jgi:signal transduction histidine kinase
MKARSLFGRLVLVLVAGIVLAQALGFFIHRWDRERMFYRTHVSQTAQRISDVVSLLDTLEPAGRQKVIAILNTRRWSAELSDSPPTLATPSQDAGLAEFARATKPLLASREHRVGMLSDTYVISAALSGGQWITLGYRRDASIVPDALIWSWLAVAIVVVIITLFAARWVTRPLSTLANAAEALGRDIERPPLDERGPSEVSRAARAFNDMQSRLRRLIEDRARIFTAMSHDLKTPITRLRLRAELLQSDALKAKFTADLAEMEAMVNSSLAFMRGMQDHEVSQPIDVRALLESLQADAQETGGRVLIQGEAVQPYEGRPQALKRALSNVIENSIRYGGGAKVIIDDSSSCLRVRVLDTGPGIPESELTRVFEPFYRIEDSRNRASGGTGLGLSIAQSIAQLHGGDIALRNLPEGGLEATLTLPRAPGSTKGSAARVAADAHMANTGIYAKQQPMKRPRFNLKTRWLRVRSQ